MKRCIKNRFLKVFSAGLAFVLAAAAPVSTFSSYAAAVTPRIIYDQSVADEASGKVFLSVSGQQMPGEDSSRIPSEELYAVSGAFDPVFYANEYPDVAQALGTEASVLQKHYETYGVYEGRKANADDVFASPSRITRIIALYLRKNQDYYLAHAGEKDFPYFNAEAYLSAYPEVKKAVTEKLNAEGNLSDAELAKAAAEHYLTYGALGGFSSCTDFDPVWAILADPSCFDFVNGSTPDQVFAAYTAQTGNTSTKNLPVGAGELSGSGNRRTGILILQKDTEQADSKNSSDENSPENSGAKTVPNAAPDSDPVISPVNIPFINAYSKTKAGPAVYYSLTDSTALSYGTFNAANYNAIKNSVSDKYTMMVFLCGSDLEDNNSAGVTSILNMIFSQYKSSEPVNIILCVGGSTTWHADALTENNNGRLSIYYLDASKVTAEQMEKVNKIAADSKAEFAKEGSDWLERYLAEQVLQNDRDLMDEIMTECLVTLGNYGQRNMSESSILSGFMNLSTDLFPAESYGLVLWDHGSGAAEGVCGSDNIFLDDGTMIEGDNLELSELEKAFHDSNLIQSGKTLDLLAMDACLMGGTETALVLSGYYKYMLACEELEMGDYSYNTLLKTLSDELAGGTYSASGFALEALKDFTASHTFKDQGTLIQSSAVFDAAMVQENASSMLNSVADDLTGLVDESKLVDEARTASGQTSDSLNALLYQKLRKAAVRCFNLGTAGAPTSIERFGYIDLLDYYEKLSEEISKTKITGDSLSEAENTYNSRIDVALKDISTALSKGFLDAAAVTYKDNKLLVSGENFSSMSDAQAAMKAGVGITENCDFYGASIFMPVTSNSYVYSTVVLGYYNSYKDSEELGGYAKFVKLMYDYEYSNAEIKRVRALRKNIDYSRLVSKVQAEASGMQISFVESYEDGAYCPENSSGDPMLDITDTVGSVSVLGVRNDTRNYYKKDEAGTYYRGTDLRYHAITDGMTVEAGDRYSYASDNTADVIVAEQKVKLSCISGANNAIIVSSDQLQAMAGYVIKGVQLDSSNKTSDYSDAVLPSVLEQKVFEKGQAVQALMQDAALNTGYYMTVKGAVITSTAADGGTKEYKQQEDNVYHIFEYTGASNGVNTYKYVGTVLETYDPVEDSSTFENMANAEKNTVVEQISADHTYISRETIGSGENSQTIYTEQNFEKTYGYSWIEVAAGGVADQDPVLIGTAVKDYTKEGISITAEGKTEETILGVAEKQAGASSEGSGTARAADGLKSLPETETKAGEAEEEPAEQTAGELSEEQAEQAADAPAGESEKEDEVTNTDNVQSEEPCGAASAEQ